MELSRTAYRTIKKLNKQQLEAFLTRQYEDAYNEGVKDASLNVAKLMEAVNGELCKISEIDEKRRQEISNSIVASFIEKTKEDIR